MYFGVTGVESARGGAAEGCIEGGNGGAMDSV